MSEVRILAGSARGRALKVPPSARPTGAMLRKSLFDVLANHYGEGCRFLDLYAGAGAVGLEAASRGYQCVLVEKDPRAVEVIERNRRTLGLEASVVRRDALAFITGEHEPFDVVFIDPPYEKDIAGAAEKALAREGLLAQEGVLVVQSPAALPLPPGGAGYRVDRRSQGSNALTYYWRR